MGKKTVDVCKEVNTKKQANISVSKECAKFIGDAIGKITITGTKEQARALLFFIDETCVAIKKAVEKCQ